MLSPAFLATCMVIVMVPGPSFTVIVSQSLQHGRGAGLLAVAGNTSALLFWATAAAFGLTALLTASTAAFVALKLTGAAYLCWLGCRALIRSRRRDGGSEPAAGLPPLPGSGNDHLVRTGPGPIRPLLARAAAYRCGLLTNLANPKPATLYLALLPQFVPAHAGAADVFTLAFTQITISAAWYLLIATLAAGARKALSAPRARRWLDRLTGCTFVGLGVRLATLARPAG